jgi:hypothetical protein
VALFTTNGNKLLVALAAAMLAIAALMHFLITPQVTEIGRAIDFTGPEQMPLERARFWNYHRAYSALELTKLGLGLWLGARLLYNARRINRRGASLQDVHPVDDPDHSHVDG